MSKEILQMQDLLDAYNTRQSQYEAISDTVAPSSDRSSTEGKGITYFEVGPYADWSEFEDIITAAGISPTLLRVRSLFVVPILLFFWYKGFRVFGVWNTVTKKAYMLRLGIDKYDLYQV